MSAPHDTQGTQLKRGDAGSPETFTAISKVMTLGTVGSARALRQITDLSHTDTHKHKLGLKDMPEISCEGFYNAADAQQLGLQTDHDNGTLRNFQIVFNDVSPAETLSFSALVSAWNVGVEVDGDIPFAFTLKPQSVLTRS